jgi:hypothetical protein
MIKRNENIKWLGMSIHLTIDYHLSGGALVLSGWTSGSSDYDEQITVQGTVPVLDYLDEHERVLQSKVDWITHAKRLINQYDLGQIQMALVRLEVIRTNMDVAWNIGYHVQTGDRMGTHYQEIASGYPSPHDAVHACIKIVSTQVALITNDEAQMIRHFGRYDLDRVADKMADLLAWGWPMAKIKELLP